MHRDYCLPDGRHYLGIAVVGANHHPGHTYEIKAISRIHRLPDELSGPMNNHGIADNYRVTILHYLLDMG